MKRTIQIIISVVALSAILASCQKDNVTGRISNREIKVRLGDGIELKSAPSQSGSELLFSVPFVTSDGDTLSIEAYISDIQDDYSSYATKGAQITTDNLASVYGSFKTSVFKDGSAYKDAISGKTMTDVTVTYSGGAWTLDGDPYYWPKEDDEITFCSFAPDVTGSGVSSLNWNGGSKLSFSYSKMPGGATAGVYSDAVNQKDIVFGIDSNSSASHTDGDKAYASINFCHALTAVKFIRGDIDGCTVKSVSLKNFYGAGTAEAVENTAVGDSRPLMFSWTPSGDLKTYVQTFNKSLGEKGAEGSVADGGSIDPTTDESCTFMMVPQELDASAAVSIVVAYGSGADQTISMNLGSITPEQAGSEENADRLKDWSTYAGKVITIKINRAGVAVAVDETFDGTAKSDVGARNTGGKIEFVRAAIVANWVNDDLDVYDTCDITDAIATGSGWTLHTDGFYYYTKAINPGAVTTNKLITSCTAPATPLDEGLHMEVTVIVQAVEYDSNCAKAKAAWGSDIPVTGAVE